MMNLYCIPGYGTDSRLFKNLQLKNFDIHFIAWAKPTQDESLSEYANKLIPQIDTTKPFSLLGMSLGGFITVELSHKVKPEHIFLISTVKSSKEIPLYLRFLSRLGIKQLVSGKLLKKAKCLVQPIFGKLNPADKKLMDKMIDETDNQLLTWAGRQIVTWASEDHLTAFKKITHIIGDKDILYSSKIRNAHIVKNGTHLMMLDKAVEINKIIDGVGDRAI